MQTSTAFKRSQGAARMALAACALVLLAGLAQAATPRTLGNTFTLLKEQKKLSIGYFGGSITAGAGASKAEQTSYRALTTKWFRAHFPGARITEINAAIGGTGSNLGAFRAQHDLLSKNPDLVFVEFAVNDGSGREVPMKRAMEGIVRQIWKANPAADIVFLYTLAQGNYGDYAKGQTPGAVRYHHDVAAFYGIPEVNIGLELYKTMTAEKKPWEACFNDGAHPKDAGYANYMKTIAAFLESRLADAPEDPVRLGKSLTENPLENGRLVDAWTVAAPGWTQDNHPLGSVFPHMLACGAPGTELSFKFNGTAIGLYWQIASDSGDIEWSVDGGKAARRSSWDKYALKYNRPNYAVLADALPPGEHTLKIKVLSDKNPQSKGNMIRIAAFMVN